MRIHKYKQKKSFFHFADMKTQHKKLDVWHLAAFNEFIFLGNRSDEKIDVLVMLYD
jgi:hypothetical protein